MSFGSLEYVVRNRVRMWFRRTWVVTILGALVLGAIFSAASKAQQACDWMIARVGESARVAGVVA